MRRAHLCRPLLAALATLLPAPLAAQSATFEIVPQFVSHFATGNIIDLTAGESHVEGRHEAGPGFGGRALFRFTRALGLEVDATWVRSAVVFNGADPEAGISISGTSLSSTTIFTSGRLVWSLPGTNLRAFGGGGMLSRSGDAYELIDGMKTSNGFGVVGFGVRAPVTTSTWLDVVVEANVYKADPLGIESTAHTDIQVKVGMPIGFGSRGAR